MYVTYTELKTMIATISDDKIRKEYSTRCTDKYNSLKDETAAWKDVVNAHEAQQREENERLAEESALKSQQAREEQTRKTKVALARTRLKKLLKHKYQPDNLSSLLAKASEAVEACKEYDEYDDLYSQYINYKAQLQALPTKEEYEAAQNAESGEDAEQSENLDE